MATAPTREFSLKNATDLFKIEFVPRSETMYNSETVLNGRIKKTYDFVGKQKNVETHLSFQGGVGSGILPVAGTARYKQAVLTAQKVYARAQVEREAIKAASSDKGAFRKALNEVTKKTVESFIRNDARILFGDGTGVLGKGDGTGTNVTGAGSEANPYVLTFPAAQWNEANFEEEDLVQVVTGLDASNQGGAMEGADSVANLLRIVDVNHANRQVKVVGTSTRLAALAGAGPLAATDGLCMQRSYLREPQGLKGVLTPYAGVTQLYGIDIQRRWSAFTKNANGIGPSTDMMNEVMLGVEKKCGKVPNLIIQSYTQYQNVLALLEDKKRYPIPNRNLVKGKELVGKFGFEGVEFMSTKGAIAMVPDRFCQEDRIYFLNDNFIERCHRPDFGWFDDDGTIFMRVNDSDEYEARYGGYYENMITPTFHGVIYGLAV